MRTRDGGCCSPYHGRTLRRATSAYTANCSTASRPSSTTASVLKSELDEQMEAVTKRLQEQKVELPPESVLRQQVLERLILQEIQAQRAKHVGLTISDEQLNGALQEIAQRNKIPFDQLPTALAAQGVDYKQYRESMRKELTLSTLRQRDVIAHINVTPHELEQFLARQAARGGQRRVQRIAHPAVAARGRHPAAAR